MAIKILGGLCKGTSLSVPKTSSTRPTFVLLKRRVFDSVQDLSGRVFVDCCAGVGGVGLEAWSRGASEVFLIEIERDSHSHLRKNVEKITSHYGHEASRRKLHTIKADVLKWLPHFFNDYQLWPQDKKNSTVFFMDPPYKDGKLYKGILDFFQKGQEGKLFSGQLWVESSDQGEFSRDNILALGGSCLKTFAQGMNFIMILQF